MNHSIWANDILMPSFPKLEQDLKTDVLVIGGGLAGILCAHQLQSAGVGCALIEANTVMSGVSQNTTAKITSQHGLIYHKLLRKLGPEMARLYWRVSEDAIHRYQDLSKSISCDFKISDNYIYSMQDPEILDAERTALQQLHIPYSFEKDLPLPFPVAGAIRFPDQAQFHPLKFAAGIAKSLSIFEHTAAKAFNGSEIITNRGRICAKHIVVATHFPLYNKHGLFFLKQFQHRSYVLALANAPQYQSMYLDEAENGLSFRQAGNILLLGGGGHRTGKKSGGWEPLESAAKRYFPEAEIVGRWAAQDCMTLDGLPYIGRYSPNTPNLFVATGFNKWGMTSSMAAANLLTDLILGKSNPYTELFSPSRSMLQPQLLINAAESTWNLLKPTKPRCPHMGCALKWNPREHSWDCPCHGSRFAANGKLLDNPATDDLK